MRPRRGPVAFAGATLVVLVAASGCGGSSDSGGSSTTTQTATDTSAALSGDITVLAAASLTGTFTTLGQQFEAAHPGTKVTFSFGPSSGLATQITNGSPADVFASASQTTMDTVVKAGAATNPSTFATNTMEIAVPPDNPAKVDALDDLASPDVKVALCQEDVPCGVVAAKVFAHAKLTVTPVSREVDVKAVLTKVQLDEVDAGMVYKTDVLAAGDKVKGVAIPDDVNASTAYPIATLAEAANPAVAAAFVDYVKSEAGTTVLTEAGFSPP